MTQENQLTPNAIKNRVLTANTAHALPLCILCPTCMP